MATIRSLYVALKASTDDYNRRFKEAAMLAKDFNRVLMPTRETLSGIGKVATAVGLTVAGGMVAMAKKAADYGDEMLEASQKTGIGTRQLAALRLMAEQSGSSFEGMTAATSRLSKTVFEAATKGGESAKLFKALGIDVKDAGGRIRDVSEIFPEFAERISKMEDGTAKTAIVMKALGKSGAEMIPTLNQGAEGFRKAAEQAAKYGLALTEAEAALGDHFNDALTESKAAMQGFANSVGVALLPALTRLVEKANDWIAVASRWVRAHPELTRVIAATAAVILGSGGLLLGLTAIVAIAPKVSSALMLVSGAFKSMSTASAAARTAQALTSAEIAAASAGISVAQARVITAGKAASSSAGFFSALGGQVSSAATAFTRLIPVVAKAGALLGAIYITKKISDFVGLTDAVKKTYSEVLRLADNLQFLGSELLKVIQPAVVTFFENLRDAVKDLVSNIPIVSGIVEKLSSTLEKFSEKTGFAKFAWDAFVNSFMPVRAIGQGLDAVNDALEKFGPTRPAATGMGNLREAESRDKTISTVIKPPPIDIGAWEKQTNKVVELTEQMWKSLKRESGEVEALEAVLRRASAAHLSLDTVADKLGSTIADVADEFRKSGQALPEYIAKYDDMIRQSQRAEEAVRQEILARNELEELLIDGPRAMEQSLREIQQAAAEAPVMTVPIEVQHSEEALRQIDRVLNRAQQTKELERANEVLEDQQIMFERTADAAAQYLRAGYSVAQVESMLGIRLDRVSESAKDLGVVLDSTTKKTIEQHSAADTLARSWGDSTASMVDAATDMIVDLNFSFKRLGDIAKDTFKGMARSALDGFFKPFKDQLRSVGEEAGKWASGLLFGTKTAADKQQESEGLFSGLLGSGGGGLLGGLIGGDDPAGKGALNRLLDRFGLGNILGNNGIFGKGGTPPFVPGSGGVTGGGMGGMAGGLGGGWAQAIAQGIDTAYKIVEGGFKPGQKAQDEGTRTFRKFFDQIVQIRESGLSFTNQLKQIENLYQATTAQINQLSGVDKNYAKAFAGTLRSVNQAVTDQRLYLQPLVEQEGGSVEPGAGVSVDFSPFRSAVDTFKAAVEVFAGKTSTTTQPAVAAPQGQTLSTLSSAFSTVAGKIQASGNSIYDQGVLQPLLTGDEWMKGLQNIIGPILTAQKAGTLTESQVATALSDFDKDIAKFHEIADSLARVSYGDPEEVSAGYAMLNPLIDKLRQALSVSAAQATQIPSLAVGGFLQKSGLVMAHAGEVVMPLSDIREAMLSKLFGRKKSDSSGDIKGALESVAAALTGKQSKETAEPRLVIESGAISMSFYGVQSVEQLMREIDADRQGIASLITKKVIGLKGTITKR